MSERFVRILPGNDPQMPGWRLRVERESIDAGIVYIAEERVHPEQVSNPDANFVAEADQLGLTWDEFVWVRDQLETIAKLDAVSRLRKLLARAKPWIEKFAPGHLLNEIDDALGIQTEEAAAAARATLAELAELAGKPDGTEAA